MQPLFCFLAGIVFISFVMPILDLILQILTNYATLHANKVQKRVNDLFPQEQEYNTNVIGFQAPEEYEEYYDDEE